MIRDSISAIPRPLVVDPTPPSMNFPNRLKSVALCLLGTLCSLKPAKADDFQVHLVDEVKISDFVSIEFRVLKIKGKIEDKDLTQKCKIWHKNVRIPISPEEYSKALKVARAAINKFRRRMKKRDEPRTTHYPALIN